MFLGYLQCKDISACNKIKVGPQEHIPHTHEDIRDAQI